MTDARTRARELLAAASPSPWSEDDCNVFSKPLSDEREAAILRRIAGSDEPHPDRSNHDEPLGFVCSCGQKRPTCDADAALIAAAPELLTALCDELDAAEAKVARLREALRPFAERAERYDDYAASACLDVDGGPRATGDCLHVAQLRAARAALAESEENDNAE